MASGATPREKDENERESVRFKEYVDYLSFALSDVARCTAHDGSAVQRTIHPFLLVEIREYEN